MQLDRPLRCVTPTLDGDVLLVLSRANTEFTAPQVHRAIGTHSVAGVRRVLGRLVQQGVVTARPAGRASLYALNRDHLASDAIVELSLLRDRLIDRIAEAVSHWRPAAALVMLFGSAARSPMRPDSDIDLLVVRPTDVSGSGTEWRQQVSELEQAVSRWTGNDTRVLEYEQLEVRTAEPGGVLGDIARDGIHVFGDRTELLPVPTVTS